MVESRRNERCNTKNKKSDETVTFPKLISSFVDGKMHVLKVACGMNHCCAITCSSTEEILADIVRMNNTDGVIDDLILTGSLSTKLYTWGYGEHGRIRERYVARWYGIKLQTSNIGTLF